MEVERAVIALEEVRVRLASCQRFRGFSGPAAILSGLVALGAGLYQEFTIPRPRSEAEMGLYLWIWLVCLALALVINYGTVAVWHFRRAAGRDRRQTQTAAFAVLPSLGLGAVLSWALLANGGIPWLLPGVWYGSYGCGLFASRTLMPARVVPVALGFCLAGAALLLSPDPTLPFSWWVMPLGFGFGQIWIGRLLLVEAARERSLP